MKGLSFCAIVLALLGTAAMLQRHVPNPSPADNADARLNNNAAFRDGLYLGRLSAGRGTGMGSIAVTFRLASVPTPGVRLGFSVRPG